MPTISPPNTLVDGTIAESQDVANMLYSPQTTPKSMAVLNGRLTATNRSWDVRREMVRPRHVTGGKSVGSTLSMDYFTDMFAGVALGDGTTVWQDRMRAIPGAGVSFRLPFDVTYLKLFWRVSVIVDVTAAIPNTLAPITLRTLDPRPYLGEVRATETAAALMLFIDDYPVVQSLRRIRGGMSSMSSDATYPNWFPTCTWFPDWRRYAGQYLFDGSNYGGAIPIGVLQANKKGWHTASLRVLGDTETVLGDARVFKGLRVKGATMGYRYCV